MAKKRRRRPGGGRKPHGEFPGKAATFTTRIQPETRRALDEAARLSRRSVSATAEYVLKQGLRKPSGEPRNLALATAIELLVENIERETKESWRDDPWTGLVLRHAVEALLFHFTPEPPEGTVAAPPAVDKAAAKMPPEFAQQFRTPAGFAHTLAYNLIHEIEQAASSTPANEWSLPVSFSERPAQVALIASGLWDAKRPKRSAN